MADQPVKLDDYGTMIPEKERRAELKAELEELKAFVKKRKEERSLRGGAASKVTAGAGAPNNELEKLALFIAEEKKKRRAERREAYRNREPPVLDLRYLRPSQRQDRPCSCTAASAPAFSEDEEGKEA